MKSKSPRHWLITAFEPFAGRADNNSMFVLNEIKKLESENASLPEWNFQFHYALLPVQYDQCFEILLQEKNRLEKKGIRLEGIMSLGEGHEEFKVETQANNLDDVPELSDNAGVRRTAQKIFADLPEDALLPLRFPMEAFARIRSSKNPGFYICNHLCAKMSRTFGATPDLPYFGFVHVPKVGSGGMFTADLCAAMIVNSFKKIVSF